MTYNLRNFTLLDRDGDGRADDPKPDSECRAVARIISEANPDILAVQEIGNETYLHALQAWLKTQGVQYEYVELLQRGRYDNNLAVLSRYPIMDSTHHTNEWYSIGKARLPVARGFLETQIQISETYSFHLLNAHLKSKIYNRLGQTEMRRNEARLLNKVVRRILDKDPDCKLLVTGDMNDNPNSAAIREVTGKSRKNLFDLRPQEPGGDAWTYYDSSAELHTRFDYFFANAVMLNDVVPEKSTVIRHPLTYAASDHRPVLTTFKTD
ncbi:endonuclease/exonuclease/phosphatase family protein [Pontiella sp. NLcol2]|uniref:Endonuclease/exonuclease/phosphatase family protein n=2 Tax=Pontiella agarivorans TaxID=3038953 RepID=A0ABU5MT39_9BACT|nr:endonuclease/exonuclease/phosphatase family protein [Pontiella agarivorans]